MIDTDGAFPFRYKEDDPEDAIAGLSKREYVAVRVLQGLIEKEGCGYDAESATFISKKAVLIADKFLEEL